MLTIVANIYAEAEHAEAVEQSLRGLVAPTLAEDGCIQYDLHRDNADPAHFVFYENWENREKWQAHMASDHINAHRKVVDGKIISADIFEMTRNSA